METIQETDYAFVRDGAKPLLWQPVARNLKILQEHFKGAWDPNAEIISIELENEDGIMKTTLISRECIELGHHFHKNHQYLLQQYSAGTEGARSVLESIHWLLACTDPNEIVTVEEVPVSDLQENVNSPTADI